MIKIAHECPITLFEDSLQFNDYDYALVHLFETHKEYYNFFRRSVLSGREVILDNSIFELGKAFNHKVFAKWQEKLEARYYIVPDVLENKHQTIENFKKFSDEYRRLPGQKIGVVQGKTYEEIKDCYRALLDLGADCIAISFDYSLYQEMYPHLSKLDAWMRGRVKLINKLLDDKVINSHFPHHLLGVAQPQEFSHYKGKSFDFIKSMDSSNPIVHGIFNVTYNGVEGLNGKVSYKLCDLLDIDLDEQQRKDIYYNIECFKKILGR